MRKKILQLEISSMKLNLGFHIFAFILAYWAFEMEEGWKDQCHELL